MNITTEITSVSVKDKPFNTSNGPIWYLNGTFQDGSQFSVGSKSEGKAQEKKAALEQLKGQQATFEVDPDGEYQGKPKYKLLSWPGKEGHAQPEKQAGPFQAQRAAGYQPRFRDTEEGARQERDSIHRSVALQQAIQYVSNHKEEGAKLDPALWCCNLADIFYEWLSKGQPKAEPQGEKPTAIKASEAIAQAVQAKDLAQLLVIQKGIVQRHLEEKISATELAILEQELKEARAGIEHAQWVASKQQEALKRDPGVQRDLLQEARDRF